MSRLVFFPEEAAQWAPQVDGLLAANLLVAVLFSALIASCLLFLAVRYQKGSEIDRSSAPEQSAALELAWTGVPLAIVLALFWLGAAVFYRERRPPRDALSIDVVGRQWMWKLQHPNGRREIDELHVPLGRPVRLRMISQDVIHSFFVPAFRVKQDVLPGRYTELWFIPTKLGSYHLFCAQYCGTSHAKMTGSVTVLEPSAYQRWLDGFGAPERPSVAPAERGARLFAKMGCSACHRDVDGRAPTLEGVYGRTVLLDDGRAAVADDDYLRRSILAPAWKRVAGFAAMMPAYQGRLSEEEVLELIEYIRSLQKGAAHG